MEMLRHTRPFLGIVVLCGLAGARFAAAQIPVKLDVQAAKRVVATNERSQLRVTLLDVQNRPVAATKNLTVQIIARFPSNQTKNLAQATIPAGKSAQTVEIPALDTKGFVYIWAKQPELRLGGLFLAVRPETKQQRRSAPISETIMRPSPVTTAAEDEVHASIQPAAGWIAQPSPGIPKPAHQAGASAQKQARRIPLPANPAAAGQASVSSGIPIMESPPITAAAVTAHPTYLLALRYSPLRGFLANGRDPATVHAFVTTPDGQPNTEDVRVNLFDSSGTLNPVPLTVPANVGMGSAELTSDTVGDVKVEYVSARPSTQLEGDRVLDIHFEPPIAAVQLKPSPARISFVDSCDLVVQFVDESGKPIATGTPRSVSLSLESGKGDISDKDFTIAQGHSDGRSTFSPLWWGPMTIAASTPNLMTQQAVVQVTPPWGLLGASLLGGFAGGFLFFLRYRRSKKLRITIGAFTGMLLYWAVLLLGLAALPRTSVLNPISAFVIAVVGGWLGLQVFEPILKKLGLSKQQPAKT